MGVGIGMKFVTPDQMKSDAETAVLYGQRDAAAQKSFNQNTFARSMSGSKGWNAAFNPKLMNQWANTILPEQDYSAKLRQMGLSPEQLQQRFQVPTVNSGPIWSEQQIQNNVNALKASSAQRADTDSRKYAEKMANQGYGTGSPLTYAAQLSIDANKMGSDSAAERAARWEAASGNANFQQQGQIAGGKLANDYLNALIGSQAQMLNMFQTNQQARSSLLQNALGQIFS